MIDTLFSACRVQWHHICNALPANIRLNKRLHPLALTLEL